MHFYVLIIISKNQSNLTTFTNIVFKQVLKSIYIYIIDQKIVYMILNCRDIFLIYNVCITVFFFLTEIKHVCINCTFLVKVSTFSKGKLIRLVWN